MLKDHLVQLRAVFHELKEAGLKLKPKVSVNFLRNHLHIWDTEFWKGALKSMTVQLKKYMNGLLPKQSLRLEAF